MAISIEDVARRAGVAQSTVSHVLNGNNHARIALATQERVKQAAADLGYRPNRLARSLGRRRTDTIGLMLIGLQNPFYVQLMESIERVAADANYQVLLDAPPASAGWNRRNSKLPGWPIDGVLMWAHPEVTVKEYLGAQAEQLPVVYLSGQPRNDDAAVVYFDVYSGARAAMSHLLRRGCRRIGFVYPYDWVVLQSDEPRYRAYRETCAESALEPMLLYMERHEETRHAGFLAGLELAAMPAGKRPDAVLCFNDIIAQGVFFGLRREGVKIPDEIAVVGFDGLDEGRYLDVPLTTVSLPGEQMSREALRILFDRINLGPDTPAQQIVIPTQLMLGGTA